MALIEALFSTGLQHYSQAFPGTRDCTTEAMQKAVRDWFDLYFALQTPDNEDPCQRIPVSVVSKLYKACFAEYKPQFTSKGGKTEYMQRCQAALDACRLKAVQLAMIGGEAWLRPVPAKDRFVWRVMRRDAVVILGRDLNDRVTDMISQEQTIAGEWVYTLLERRSLDEKGLLTIQNRLFRSANGHGLGVQVDLSALPAYEALLPDYTFAQPVDGLGLVSLRMPLENTVDGSDDAVSVYSAATGLIHNINHNEWLLNQEFDHGAIRVIASDDLLTKRRNEEGDVISKRLEPGLFTGLEDDPDAVGITVFAPSLRDASFHARKTEYLRNVESVIGLKRGLLSEVESADRTATEVSSSAGDYSLTVQDLWQMWETANRKALQLCDQLGQLYQLEGCDSTAFDLDKDFSIAWGNGVLYDRDKDNSERLAQVQAGLLMAERYLGWYYDLPHETPEDRARIREDYMPRMEQLLEE